MPPTAGIDADESLGARWWRRARSLAGLSIATSAWLSLLPVLVPLALVVDVARAAAGPARFGAGRFGAVRFGAVRFGAVRFVAMVAAYLGCESAGVAASGWLWLTRGRDPSTWIDRNFRLQCWWAGTLFAIGQRLFTLRVQVDGADAVGPGPIVLLVRHASVADTLVPAVFVSSRVALPRARVGESAPGARRPLTRRGLLLRYVLKRELLWDPCLDIVGQRLPNVFVRRGSADPAREIATVRRLAEGLGPAEGVILFPEGTRFSPKRRADALAKLAASDPALARRASGLTHTLPPRLGGTFALLDAAPDADVVVCGHVGFDGALRLADLWNGALVGREVRITFWRCPRATIPADRAGRVDWLYGEWERLDAWVAANGQPRALARVG